ncbi:MAG TPA: DNA polymerase Y family protein [Terracidiphilus sp.]|jgi:protein ImuB|nr:DNA polymerase Y family protein [Terracidiphilus sp.]
MSRPEELYACVCAREFPAQALLRLRPELRPRACAVMEGEPPLQQVCAMTEHARTMGVACSMTKVEVETFPNLAILSRSPQEEAATRVVLLECAGSFSPRVEECSQDRTFRCVLDISGTELLFGPPQQLAQTLRARIRALGIAAFVAVSRNVHAAIVLAAGLSAHQPVSVVAAGQQSEALAPLPVSVLDLTDEQQETFALWGITTLGRLAELPQKELIARMGQDGHRLRQLARGERPHLFQPVEPPFVLSERMDLDTPVELLDSLLFVIGAMLDQLIQRAHTRILALAAITVTLSLEGGATHIGAVRPALPTCDKQLWIRLLHLDLEAHPPSAAIVGIALEAEPGKTDKVQLGLFSPQLPEPSRLDVTLARIRALVGEENAGRAVLRDAHAPESFRMEPFALPRAQHKQADAPPSSSRMAMRRLRPQERASVILQHEKPASFSFRERRYTVERAYGPWAASGDWWNPSLWAMEEWDLVARAQDGSLLCCLMTRAPAQNLWEVAALYD